MFDFRERRSPRWSVMLLMLVVGAALGAAGGKSLGERGAEEQARQAAQIARAELAAAVCADDFMDQQAARAALLRLVNVEWPRRAELLSKQGWATMPDREAPDPAVARLCALKLGEAYASVRQSAPIAP
jgi:hypothetical protein